MKPKPPSNESKKEKFRRLAEHRTNEVMVKLQILGNCANRQAYDYDEEEIDKIFNAIEKVIKEVKAKFDFPKEREFKL